MLDFLNSIDTSIFLFLNGMHSAFFDVFMYTFSGKWIWVPFYAALLFYVVRNWRKQQWWWIILALILCIVLADQVSSGIIKQIVQRPRPSRAIELEGMVHIVNGYTGGRFGFVSSHAANTFGLALLCSLLFRNKVYTWTLFAWATVTAYSRIYLGVHYPFDIAGGIIVGMLAAWLCYALLKKFKPQLLARSTEHNTPPPLARQHQIIPDYLPVWTLLLTTVGIAVYSFIIS